MLQSVGPKPLIEPATLTSDADWVRAGQRVFDEFDIAAFRVLDPKVIALARSPQGFAKSSVKPRADGTLPDLRWIPTSKGVALGPVELRAVPHAPDAGRNAPAGRTLQRDTLSDRTIQNGAVGSIGGRARRRHAANVGVALVGDAVDQRRYPRISEDGKSSADRPPLWCRRRTRAVPSLEWQRVLSDENSRSHRHQGSQIHRSHGDASASRPWRSDAIRGARHLQRLVRFRAAPHAHRRAAARALPRAGRSAVRAGDVHLFARAAGEPEQEQSRRR